jgi:hypothetical protein
MQKKAEVRRQEPEEFTVERTCSGRILAGKIAYQGSCGAASHAPLVHPVTHERFAFPGSARPKSRALPASRQLFRFRFIRLAA